MENDEITSTKSQKRYNEMQRNAEAMEKALKKLARLVARIDKLRIERNRLRKLQEPPKIKETLKITGEDWHKIRHQVELNDPIDF